MSDYFSSRISSRPGSIAKFFHSAIVKTINGKQTVVGWQDETSYQDFDQVEKVTRSRSGSSTPNFSTKIMRAGFLPVTSFSHNKSIETYPIGYYKTTNLSGLYAGQYSLHTGEWPRDPAWVCNSSGLTPTTSQQESLKALCANKVLLKIKDQKANILQMVAERHKTVSMIASRVRQIAEAALALRRGDIRGAARGLGAGISNRRVRSVRRALRRPERGLSSSWLELQYGWKPLLGEIHGLAELLAQQDDRIQGIASATVSMTFPYLKELSLTGGYDLDVGSCDTRVKYTIIYQATIPGIPTMAQLGVTNPALLAWELLPFSFVVDWFFPIGNALSALDATAGLRFSTGCYSVTHNMMRTRTRETTVDTTTSRTEFSKSQKFSAIYHTRTRITSFPSPRMPQFKNPVSLTHLANAMALLGVAFGRR